MEVTGSGPERTVKERASDGVEEGEWRWSTGAKNRDGLLDWEVELRRAKICGVVTGARRSTRSGSGADATNHRTLFDSAFAG